MPVVARRADDDQPVISEVLRLIGYVRYLVFEVGGEDREIKVEA